MITNFIFVLICCKDVSSKHKVCSYCNKPINEELWCNECDPHYMIEGWTSENSKVDKFIKDSIYNARSIDGNPIFLEWVLYNRFVDIKLISEGGFSKVYSATWLDGKSEYEELNNGSWKKLDSKPMKVALKKLNGSQNISDKYLNELKICWNIYLKSHYLSFYGMTKDPITNEFIMILEFANNGSLRNILSYNFNNMLWKDKIKLLYNLAIDLKNMHELGYFHKDFHSGNILQNKNNYYISDFGLSGKANEQKSDSKIYGVLPYIAPEVLDKDPYTLSSDIYSFGVIMAELSSGKPPFYDRKHNLSLALDICNGLRPEFEKGTPEIYKKLAYRCMNADPNQRLKASELMKILVFWYYSISQKIFKFNSREIEAILETDNEIPKIIISYKKDTDKYTYSKGEIKTIFEEADKEIPNISTSYKKVPDAIYTSRAFTFSSLPRPVNSITTTSCVQGDEEVYCHDSQLVDLDVKR
ncbi:kinase-like domain-containing protein [Rhizophagus irregularis DAOM 181602=DAOM 197198]|uniref:Gin4p n=3 Tax=Rhizophagus irregularis TaxID=588596 RepID=A0A015J487_RHIIW|nr:kinase-like domain-containing protein [Rhizophagus irregularis DAOM 181602=DAOM 197198]EXX61550.1 Gin4p [Rhizophagus irregularis DAOM 197198w]POG60047.1 kinase-like domain-containing protein [Rhizophagus irregularis DAOM 181602=DAOM 197198]|eukprot:XP_025166913.1 kinase-like domain-containing protein [Rhizophagus irregularis DAOM 181602=DAOM 197198]